MCGSLVQGVKTAAIGLVASADKGLRKLEERKDDLRVLTAVR